MESLFGNVGASKFELSINTQKLADKVIQYFKNAFSANNVDSMNALKDEYANLRKITVDSLSQIQSLLILNWLVR